MTSDPVLLALANRGLARVPPVSLDPQEIERFVCAREGVARVPGSHWRSPFEQLCRSLEEEAALTPLGRIMANGQLVGVLRARCRAERLLAARPEILERPLQRPIIILGSMRSGSTRLQRLLACDSRLGWTRLFETLFPVPGRGGNARRIAAAAAVHGTLRMLNPAIQRIHPSGPLRPDEEFGFLSFAFHSGQYAVQWKVPGFVAAERRRDLGPVARELALLLRINGWARGERSHVPVLKCPAYSAMLEALLDTFPDARLVRLGRDPLRVVASSASLVVEQRRIHSHEVEPAAVGREWLERTAERERRVDEVLRRRSDVPVFDLHYNEMEADWVGAMHRLYRFLALPLDTATLRAMRRYTGRARAHRGHRYDLADFGLSEGEVRRAFTQSGPSPVTAPSMIAAE